MNSCSFEGCARRVLARGWCNKHYLRWYKHGDPAATHDTLNGIAKAAETNRRHGLRDHPLYATWRNMMARCYKHQNPKYARYGGRGITVCGRWHDLRNFVADVGQRPDGTTLDRKDNDGPYSPENCRWATPVVQTRNRAVVKLTDQQRQEAILRYEKCGSPSKVAQALGIQVHDVKNVVYSERARSAKTGSAG